MTNNTVYRYLGYGTTDSTGTAKLDHDANGDAIEHSYTGVGAGEIDVVASLDNPIASGSIVSETYSVLDCLVKDVNNSLAVTDYTLSSTTNTTLTIVDDYKLFHYDDTSSNIRRCTLDTSITLSDFEIVGEIKTDDYVNICLYTSDYSKYSIARLTNSDWNYFKIKRIDNVVTMYTSTDGTNWTSKNLQYNQITNENVKFVITLGSSSSSTKKGYFKNIKVYPI